MAHDVFVSFKSEDRETAEKICDELSKRGIQYWISSRSIRGGQNFQQAIPAALLDASVMVLVFSSAADRSDDIPRELALASKYKKLVIPVRTEDFFPEKNVYALSTCQFIDLFKEWEKGIDRLAEDIEYHLSIEKAKAIAEKGETPVFGRTSDGYNDRNENKYLDLLNMAYADGAVSISERTFISQKEKELGISPERAKELEEQVKSRVRSPESDATEIGVNATPAPSGEAKQWPEIGIQFLRKLKAAVESKLPFEPEGISSEEEEKENWGVWWYVRDKHYYAAWLYNKHTPNVSLSYGFHSDNEKRDPLFRTIADDLQSKGVAPDAEDDDTEEGGCFFLPEGELGVYAEKRIRIDELASSALLEETSARFSDFIAKTWPVISPHYAK